MFLRLDPLLKHRDYRLLFVSQLVSYFGTMISYVAVPYQVYEISKSSMLVGLLGTVQLIPLLVFGLLGGAVADSMNRKRLLLASEAIMSLGTLGLMINALRPHPSVVAIFVLTALIQSAVGFHRPALDALTQKLVPLEDLPAVSALNSLRSSGGAIVGPMLGGLLIAFGGPAVAYATDFATFVLALVLISLMGHIPRAATSGVATLAGITEGLRYALRRPELVGTYAIDLVAMTFAFPTALFPAMSETFHGTWGGARAAGMLFSAMSVGALVMTVLSGWTSKVRRHGVAVVLAASLWGVAIVGVGLSHSLEMALLWLAVAGGADMVSGLFRGVIWNETIPNEMRGRLSGIEMISYMAGPLLGNARAGWIATVTTPAISIYSGGLLCVAGVAAAALLLPQFWLYRSAAR